MRGVELEVRRLRAPDRGAQPPRAAILSVVEIRGDVRRVIRYPETLALIFSSRHRSLWIAAPVVSADHGLPRNSPRFSEVGKREGVALLALELSC